MNKYKVVKKYNKTTKHNEYIVMVRKYYVWRVFKYGVNEGGGQCCIKEKNTKDAWTKLYRELWPEVITNYEKLPYYVRQKMPAHVYIRNEMHRHAYEEILTK